MRVRVCVLTYKDEMDTGAKTFRFHEAHTAAALARTLAAVVDEDSCEGVDGRTTRKK